MNNIHLFVFDLDGTLTESSDTIYKCTLKTFEHLGQNFFFPKEELDKRLGEHFEDIFNELGIHVENFETFIDMYKTYYPDFIHTSTLYLGVEETITALKAAGKKIALLTTKGQSQAEMILQHFKLYHLFDEIVGRRPGVGHKPSPEPLLYICEALSVLPENTVMVGDTEVDVQCGKNAGTKTCAVSYGFRTRDILEQEKPDLIINAFAELLHNKSIEP